MDGTKATVPPDGGNRWDKTSRGAVHASLWRRIPCMHSAVFVLKRSHIRTSNMLNWYLSPPGPGPWGPVQGPQYRPMGAVDGIKYPEGLCTHPCGGGDVHSAVFVLKYTYSHVKHAQLVSISSGTWTVGTGSRAPVPSHGGSRWDKTFRGQPQTSRGPVDRCFNRS